MTAPAKPAVIHKYELFYYPNRGTAEPLRWFFKVFNVPFKNTLVRFGTTPDQMIDTFYPDQKWPLLVVEGRIPITQPAVIARYLSKQFGAVPEDPFLAYRVEQVCDIVEDCFIITRPLIMDAMRPELLNRILVIPSEEKVDVSLFTSQIIGRYIEQLYGIMNDTEGDFILGDKITYADIYLAHTVDVWETAVTLKFMDHYEEYFRKYKNKIKALPQIQQWIAENPQCIF